jgi:threonine dehydrogenase-like Zn-dependent dehydrogenase
MRAVVWTGNNRFEFQHTVEKPAFGPQQILVQVKAASVCTTDFHYADFKCVPPIVPGHEVAGVAIEIGKVVKNIQVGDRVTLDPVQRCGECTCCVGGYEHLCLNARHLGDTDIPGGWGEFVAVDAQNTHRIPDGVSFEQAALTEPTAVCLQSFQRARFQKGQTVLILGDGTFGFIHAMFAKILGAATIIVAGHYEERLSRIAAKTGALTCNTHHEKLEKFLKKFDVQPGVDLVIECTGATVAPNLGLQSLRPRGTLIIFSLVWKPEILDLNLVSMKELNVLGSCRSLHCFDRCLDLMAQGQLNIDELIDIKVPLEDVTVAMERLTRDKKNCFKALLIP